jgi:pyrroline-5-carboxylate reductase
MNRGIVLVGCGNMGRAMLEGWITAGKTGTNEVHVVEPADGLRDKAAALGCAVHASPETLPSTLTPSIVLFAVKPQVMRDVVPAYRHFKSPDTTFVSIAAGTPIAVFEDLLGRDASVIRSMPNTPAAIGKGMIVSVANAHVRGEAKRHVTALFSANGIAAEVEDENLIDAVTAVSGSGPAYVFHFIEALTQAAEKAGLPAELSRTLASQTVYGAACLAAESAESPETLRKQVTSPNGTTQAGLEVLMKGLSPLLAETVAAAKRRSIELKQ